MTDTGTHTTMTTEALEAHCIQLDTQPSAVGVNGVLVLDKPEGMTSFSLAALAKKLLGVKKVGHCGTLDPFATGVLVICVNQATRIADQLSLQDKLYRFSIRFGIETDTLDKTGQVVQTYNGPPIHEDGLLAALGKFSGPYRQQVPRYAAVKVQGKRLYELARKGIEVDLPVRDVVIHHLELLGYEWPEAQLEVHCSKGTYVRQLAADIGIMLSCGAHVNELRRLASGPFDIAKAISLEELKQAAKTGLWKTKLISMNDALAHLPELSIEDEGLLKNLYNGHLDPEWEASSRDQLAKKGGPVRLLATEDHLVALWWPEYRQNDGNIQRCLRVFK